MNNKTTEIIDDIEMIRAQNNTLWMNILRIALEKDPGQTKDILREINENDSAISSLLKEVEE